VVGYYDIFDTEQYKIFDACGPVGENSDEFVPVGNQYGRGHVPVANDGQG
jgi:hypothetical protein